jgi:hypothetical protein
MKQNCTRRLFQFRLGVIGETLISMVDTSLMHHVCLLLIPCSMLSRDCKVDLFDSLPSDHKTQDHAVVRRFRRPDLQGSWIGAPWRDTTPYLCGEFAHYALKLEGEVVAIALDLGAEIERNALGKVDEAVPDRTN